MFQQLATYLSQYKQVAIPGVGSFELVQQPATLDVASKLIKPPLYLPRFSDRDSVREHQLDYLALDLNSNKDSVRTQLEEFGRELKKKIQHGALLWKGIGKLFSEDAKMVFQPDEIEIDGLQWMPAEKVLRKNVQHTVLRGEQEVLSASFYEEEKTVGKRRSLVKLIGWIVVALAVIFIIVYLYRNSFNTSASGNKMRVGTDSTISTYK